jgi:tetratricopeptide (TPR) repeat protein
MSELVMPKLYLSIIGAVVILVTISTLYNIWTNRERLKQEDLNDEDRAFIFRLTLFVIYPLIQYASLKTTTTICGYLGGHVQSSFYSLLWYSLNIVDLNTESILISFLAGFLVQIFIALIILPALIFRPHPYLATLIGYSSVFILFACLIIEPTIAFLGLPSSLWHLTALLPNDTCITIFISTSIAAILFLLTIRSEKLRLIFAGLSRPQIALKLKQTLDILQDSPNNLKLISTLAILYSQAGLPDKAQAQLNKLRSISSESLHCRFLFAYLSYFKRNFKDAQKSFIALSDHIHSDAILKAIFLSAAALSAVADKDLEGALNASDRALEFDDSSVIARIVKVDVFMQRGKKKAAQEEILLALGKGLDMDLENKIPLDFEQVLALVEKQEQIAKKPTKHTYSKV